MVRHPLGGLCWHHLQYLVGFQRLGHEVIFLEDYGWEGSCYDPARDCMTDDPAYGVSFLQNLLHPFGLDTSWCYLAADGRAYGMSREALAVYCDECDIYFNLSNINWIPELERCRRRVLVDTDPVFTQIGGFGMGGPFSQYDVLFTYGENVHRRGCEMPTGGARWLPTRQPVTLDLWPVTEGDKSAPFTTVINWSAYGDREYQGKTYGQKDREFASFFELPREVGEPMAMAVNGPPDVRCKLADGGWRLDDPRDVTRDTASYQRYIGESRAEFCVAKHAYVTTGSGWFSDRSAAYMAMGRPVVLQDTGFSRFLPCGEGLLAFRTHDEAVAAIQQVRKDYAVHCRAARSIAETYFDARQVLSSLLECSL